MSCKCNLTLTKATEVTTASGATVITVPTTQEFSASGIYNILLSTPIPSGTDGTTLTITNGTISGNVMRRNGNYFRPLPLRSRTVLSVQYFDDPTHFQIIKVRGCMAGCYE